MAPTKSSADLKNLLSQFIGESDPLFEILKWLTEKLMLLEAEQKAGAKKGVHSKEKATHKWHGRSSEKPCLTDQKDSQH